MARHKNAKKQAEDLLRKARAETESKPVILIADTSPSILSLLEGTFQLNNFTVYTATSARQCLAIYSGLKDVIDMVLMDGNIASDQAVEVIFNIRKLKRDQKILAVVEEEGVKATAMRVGADVAVMKPLTPDSIVHQVNDMLLKTESFIDRKKSKFQKRG